MDLSIVIVSYNTADQIGACLASIEAAAYCAQEIIVVDNASSDGSAAFIGKHFPGVCIIANETNRGFAAANNQALAVCRGRYILFLNPDTELKPDALHEMLTFMQQNPHFGIAGPKIVNPDGSLQESVSYRYPGQKYAGAKLQGLPGAIACVLGAAMIAREECIRKVGGFDEEFFLYGEDQDLCLRIRQAGHEIGYIDRAIVIHLGGQSERLTVPAEVWKKKSRAEYLFYRKHFPPAAIARIRRADLLKACYRLVTLKLAMPFAVDRTRAKGKQIKYRAIYEELIKLTVPLPWREGIKGRGK